VAVRREREGKRAKRERDRVRSVVFGPGMMIVLLFACFVFFVTARGSSLASSVFLPAG
jgi:hypothetical protein